MGCRVFGAVIFTLLLLTGGCASPVIAPNANNTVIVVPGIGGDDSNYGGVCKALAESGDNDCLQVFNWGPGWPLFFVALSSSDLHDHTEIRLAEFVTHWRTEHPHSRIVLIGHSAGTGIVLGMLARLDSTAANVGPVILLAPAVSPDYDLRPALQHTQTIHVFYSEKDDLWLGLGTIILGGYDGVHRNDAGRRGFSMTTLNKSEKQRVIQHAYDPRWDELGEHGGHFDWMKPDFVKKVILPLVDSGAGSAETRVAGEAAKK